MIPKFWLALGILQVLSFLFYFIVLSRVRGFVRPHNFLETKDMRLFGIFSLRTVFVIYFFALLFVGIIEFLIFFFALS